MPSPKLVFTVSAISSGVAERSPAISRRDSVSVPKRSRSGSRNGVARR
jgi:hypothetical protein